MRKIIFSCLTFLLFSSSSFSESQLTYILTDNCKKAYQNIFSLRINDAQKYLRAERIENPSNVAVDVLENLSACLTVFIQEDKTQFEKEKLKMNERLDRVERLDESSPYYLFCKAEIYFHWAAVKVKFGEYYTAAIYTRKAYRMVEENDEKFPSFLPNKKYLGLLHAAIGLIPEQYKWLASMVGFKGTLEQGFNEVSLLADCDSKSEFSFLKKEASLLLGFIQLNFKKNPLEAKKIGSELYESDNTPLISFLMADVYIHSGENDAAIHVLENVPSNTEYLRISYFDYMLGLAKLCRMDKDADIYFNNFLSSFSGENYVKAAYQKLAWFYLLQGSKNKYFEMILELKKNGRDIVDEDKQAKAEAESQDLPNLILLRARLLFDGGYYQKALAQFSGTTLSDFPTLKNQFEVTYRVARIYHRLGETSKAIEKYQEALKNGFNFPYYFAANSALQLGLIYEEKRDYEHAEFYYKKCLTMRNHEYQNSIDQKAKTGLSRISRQK